MGMAKANGSLRKPKVVKNDKSCFATPPSEVPEIDSTAVVTKSPSEALADEPYVQAANDADNTISTASSDTQLSAYLAYMGGGYPITVTFYHYLNNDATARSFFNDFSKQQDNVHISFLKIHNFRMKLKESLSFNYDNPNVRSTVTGEAVLYPYFVPWTGDLFVYEVEPGVYGLYKITDPPTRLTIREMTGHEIKFILVQYLDNETLAKLNACVADEKYFNLQRYISGEGALLTSDETETLGQVTTAISKLCKYYVSEFFDKYIYNTFIENKCLYDPYLVEFILKVFDYKYFKSYPVQLVASPEWWSRSIWARLLDPESVPEEILVTKCFRMLKGVHYRTAGTNALTNRCYIKLHPCGRHPYPPFNIPTVYDEKELTVQQQIVLYLNEGKVRPKVLLGLVDKIFTCSRLARFYFIPILIFLLKKLQGVLETGSGVDIVTDNTDNCDLNCTDCIYACWCMHRIREPHKDPSGVKNCCCGKHHNKQCCTEYHIPDDGGSALDDGVMCKIVHDCGERFEGLPPSERDAAIRAGSDPTHI